MDTTFAKNLLRFLSEENVRTLAIICLQFGDTGKGKLVDLLAAYWADIIARGTGGANAGHTIKVNGVEQIFHLVPSGIMHDRHGKMNIIGRGVALDPRILIHELNLLTAARLTFNNMLISRDAHVVLPQHLLLDRLSESDSGKIGTTGRGIGPLYQDHTGRIGMTVTDMLNEDHFVGKLRRNLRDKLIFLKTFDGEVVKSILEHEHLGNGRYWHSKEIINIEAVTEDYMEFGRQLKTMVCDTDDILRKSLGGKKVLLEGAQGVLLSVLHGAHPHVTSSDCSLAGLAGGAGIRESDVDMTLAIAKAPYMTRVGGGPFPTEFGGVESEEHCATQGIGRNSEKSEFNLENIASPLDAPNEFFRGVAIRMLGGEYGSTTGRSRRTGRLDLPLLRYALQFAGEKVALTLTKMDVMDSAEEIEICTEYEYRGPDYQLGNRMLRYGDRLKVAIMDDFVLRHCYPINCKMPGWKTKTSGTKEFKDLPVEFRQIVNFITTEVGVTPRIISVGADRDETVFNDECWTSSHE